MSDHYHCKACGKPVPEGTYCKPWCYDCYPNKEGEFER